MKVNGESGGEAGTEVGVVDDDSDGGCVEDRDLSDTLVIDSEETEDNKTTEDPVVNDLASVSRLINIDNPMRDFLPATTRHEDRRSMDDEEADGEDGDDEGEGENPSNSSKKATSAYSAAPHKISCPHCDRKFPWQSSLNRHILTHTGSKPYR